MEQYEAQNMKEIMHTYGDYMLRLSYLYVKDWVTAEDIVQDVFIKFFETQHQFEERATLKTYLAKITINRCHDYLRSWKSRKQLISNYLLKQIHAEKPSIDSEMLQRLEKLDIAKNVLQLSVKYREVIILFYYEELTTAAIGELLNLSENTIKTRLRRAREMLKLRLVEAEWEVLRHE